MAILPINQDDNDFATFEENFDPGQRIKIRKAREAGFSIDEIQQGFDFQLQEFEQTLGVEGPTAIQNPTIDPVFAVAGGLAGAGQASLRAGLSGGKALLNAFGGGIAAIATEPFVGTVQEQIQERSGSSILGIGAGLLANILAGRLEVKALNKIGTGLSRLRGKVSPPPTPGTSRSRSSTAQTASFDGAINVKATQVDEPVRVLGDSVVPQVKEAENVAITLGDVKALQTKALPPGSNVQKIPAVQNSGEEATLSVQHNTDVALREFGGGADARTLEIEKRIAHFKGGRPPTQTKLKDLNEEQIERGLSVVLGQEWGMPTDDALVVVKSLPPLKKRSVFAAIEKKKAGRKQGRQEELGGALKGEVKVGQEALESLPSGRTEVSAGLEQEVATAKKLMSTPAIKQRGALVSGRTKAELSSSVVGSLKQLQKEIGESATSRGYGTPTWDPKKRVYQLWGKGLVEEFRTFADLQKKVLSEGLIKVKPVEVPTPDGSTVLKKTMSGAPLTGVDKAVLRAQRQELKKVLDEGNREIDAPPDIQRVDPSEGRVAGVKAPAKKKVDVDLEAKERNDELAKLIAEQETDFKTSSVGNLSKVDKDSIVEDLLTQGEREFAGLDPEDLTFGAGAGQVASKLKNFFTERVGTKAKGLTKVQKDAQTLRRVRSKGLTLSERTATTQAIQAQKVAATSKAREATEKRGASKGGKLKKGFKVSAEVADKFLAERGVDPVVRQYIKTRVLGKTQSVMTNPFLQAGVSADPKIAEAGRAIAAGDFAFRQAQKITRAQWKAKAAAVGIEVDSPRDHLVTRYLDGKIKTVPPNVKQLAEEIQRLYGEGKKLLELEKKGIALQNYNHKVTDFENLYTTFKKTLFGKKWEDLDAQYKNHFLEEDTLKQLQRVFRGNNEWRTVSKVDRKRLKEAFNLGAQKWKDLPPELRDGLPEAIFNQTLLHKGGKGVPSERSAIRVAVAYADAVSKAIHMQPALDFSKTIHKSISGATTNPLSNAKQIQRNIGAMLGKPTYDDQVLEEFAQATNEILGREIFKMAKIQMGVRQVNTFVATGALAANIAPALGNLTSIIFPMMKNGSLLSPLTQLVTNPELKKQALGLLDEMGDILQQGDLDLSRYGKNTQKFLDMQSTFVHYALSPLNISENIFRGYTVLSELQAGIENGLDMATAMSLSGAKAGSYIPEFQMTDLIEQVLQQTVATTNRGLPSQQSPLLAGKSVGAAARFFTTFPINALGQFSKLFVEAIETDDKWKMIRFLAVIGSLWAVPTALEKEGYDVKSMYGPQNFLVRFSAPVFRGLWNAGIAAGGYAVGMRQQSVENAEHRLQKIVQNFVPFNNVYQKYKKTKREIVLEARIDSRLRQTNPLTIAQEPWKIHAFAQAGIKEPATRNARQIQFNAARQEVIWKSDRKDAIQVAAEAVLDGKPQLLPAIQKALVEKYPRRVQRSTFARGIEGLLGKNATQRFVQRFGRENEFLVEFLETQSSVQ